MGAVFEQRGVSIARFGIVPEMESIEPCQGLTQRALALVERHQLWGADLTLVWVLGILPVSILGVVDYHGSRLLCLERMRLWPTAAQVASALEATVDRCGAPARLLTDRAPVFGAAEVEPGARTWAAWATARR